MPNMAFVDYEFGIKSPNSTIITTEEACLQEEIDVESYGLAILKDKPKRQSLCKRFKRFIRHMFCGS